MYISLPFINLAVDLQHHQLQELLELLGHGADPGAPGGRPDERILAPLDIEDSGPFQLRAAVHVRQRQQLHTVPVLNSWAQGYLALLLQRLIKIDVYFLLHSVAPFLPLFWIRIHSTVDPTLNRQLKPPISCVADKEHFWKPDPNQVKS